MYVCIYIYMYIIYYNIIVGDDAWWYSQGWKVKSARDDECVWAAATTVSKFYHC